jgi:monoterpene epsilon-lactone hydrolase
VARAGNYARLVPSRRHALLAYAVPRVRRAQEMADEPAERARVEAWHATLDRSSLPTRLVPAFDRRWSLVTEQLEGPAGTFASYVVTPRGHEPTRTLVYVHGGGFMAPIDPFQVRYALRLATAIGARVVLPDYPLAPEHSWRDSHDTLADLTARWTREKGGVVLSGDSAGGGYALALALTLRDRGGPQPTHLVLHAPWVDLTTSTPETDGLDAIDPWLFVGKMRAYASWWAGAPEDLGRPEVSPGLGNLTGLPRTIVFQGTRDLLLPGTRLLVDRAEEAGWDLTYVEEDGLLHVYPILPIIPESRRAFRQTLAFLRDR